MFNEDSQRNTFYPLKLGIDRHAIDFNSSICNFMKKEVYKRQFDRHLYSNHPIMLRRIKPLFCYSNMIDRYDGVLSHLAYTCYSKSKGTIVSLKWFNDGKRVLTGTKLSELAIWNGVYFNFEDIKRIPIGGGAVTCLEWSKKDNLFAGNSLGHIVILSSALNLLDNYAYEGLTKPVQDLSLSCCNTKLAGCADTCNPIIWDVKTRKVLKYLKCKHVDTNSIGCLSWNPVNNVIASGNITQLISFWDIRMDEPIISINAHKANVNKIKWNNDGIYLLSCSKDSLIKLWDIRKFEIIHFYKNDAGTNENTFTDVTATINDRINYDTTNINTTANTINVNAHMKDRNIDNISNNNNSISNIMINENTNNENITNDPSNANKAGNTPNFLIGMNKFVSNYEPINIAWNPIQNHIFVSGDNTGSIKFFSTYSNKCIQTITSAHGGYDKSSSVTLLDWNPLGHLLISFGDDKLMKFWSAASCGGIIANEIDAPVIANIHKNGTFPNSKYITKDDINLAEVNSDQSIYDSDEQTYEYNALNDSYYKKYSKRKKRKHKIINKRLSTSTPSHFDEHAEVHYINEKKDIYEMEYKRENGEINGMGRESVNKNQGTMIP